MQRWKATLAYDGTAYYGWQIQPSRPTVQGTLRAALHHLTGESSLPQGAGRTDAGVHALAQVAHFDLACPIPPGNLHRALNRSLPPAIRIQTLTHAEPGFHARHHAISKTYEYRILPRAADCETVCPPTLAPYVWPCPRALNLDLLNQAASRLLGTHDFTTFAAVNPDQSTRAAQDREDARAPHPPLPRRDDAWVDSSPPTPNTRTIHSSEWLLDGQTDPPLLVYRITGSGFLHHMVRNLVGTIVECGAARRDPAEIPVILAQRSRRLAGPTAPPQGLFLAEVHYP